MFATIAVSFWGTNLKANCFFLLILQTNPQNCDPQHADETFAVQVGDTDQVWMSFDLVFNVLKRNIPKYSGFCGKRNIPKYFLFLWEQKYSQIFCFLWEHKYSQISPLFWDQEHPSRAAEPRAEELQGRLTWSSLLPREMKFVRRTRYLFPFQSNRLFKKCALAALINNVKQPDGSRILLKDCS